MKKADDNKLYDARSMPRRRAEHAKDAEEGVSLQCKAGHSAFPGVLVLLAQSGRIQCKHCTSQLYDENNVIAMLRGSPLVPDDVKNAPFDTMKMFVSSYKDLRDLLTKNPSFLPPIKPPVPKIDDPPYAEPNVRERVNAWIASSEQRLLCTCELLMQGVADYMSLARLGLYWKSRHSEQGLKSLVAGEAVVIAVCDKDHERVMSHV